MQRRNRLLRLGVISSETRLPHWQVRCLEALLTVDGLEPSQLVVSRALADAGQERPQGWRDRLRRFGGRRHEPCADAAGVLGRFEAIHLQPEAARSTVRAAATDVLLWLGEGRPDPRVIAHPTHGVWIFEIGGSVCDERGEPSPVLPVRLVRLAEQPQDDVILCEGFFPPQDVEAALRSVAGWPAKLIRALIAGRPIGGEPRGMPTVSLRPAPVRRAERLRNLTRTVHWNVGIADVPIHAFLDVDNPPPIRWLPDPGRRFLADPFAFERDGEIVLLVEDYDYEAVQATITSMRSRDGRTFDAPETALDIGSHLSYPYVLEHEGRTYAIPEQSASGEVALYEVDPQTGRFERLCTLIEGFPAVDSTVFRHEGRWWLLCTNARDLDTTNLYAFYADELRGPWTPHASNPIKSDVRSSRPAGTPFVHEGALYRPAQDCSVEYGGAVAINRVLELTPTRFREQVAAVVRPDPHGPYPHGLHTLCAVGGRTVVDGNRWLGLREDPWLIARARAAMTARRLRRQPGR